MVYHLIEIGHIAEHRLLAQNLVELSIKVPAIAELYQGPGQFVNLLTGSSWDNPLRRPMSIASVEGDVLTVIFKVVGPCTRKLNHLRPGDTIDILGPLGNTFSLTPEQRPVLVGGGVGLAPVLNLYELFLRRQLNPILILGARSDEEHFLEHEPENNIWLTTDDGSSGLKGTVMAAVRQACETGEYIMYGCGPEPMLEAIQQFAGENNIKAELAVESYMACGVGICQGCVIKRKNGLVNEHSYHERFALVCTEGPVFDAREVDFG